MLIISVIVTCVARVVHELIASISVTTTTTTKKTFMLIFLIFLDRILRDKLHGSKLIHSFMKNQVYNSFVLQNAPGKRNLGIGIICVSNRF